MVDIASSCTLYPDTAAGWETAVALRQTLTYRTFLSGPCMWAGNSNNFRTYTLAKPEFYTDAPVGDGTSDTWEQIAGGTIYTDAPTRTDANVTITTSQGYQGSIRQGSNLSNGVNAIFNADATEKNKFFIAPMIYPTPTGSVFLSGGRCKYEIWQLIAANGVISGSTTTDHVYESLGRRWAKSIALFGLERKYFVFRWDKEGNRTSSWSAPTGIADPVKWAVYIAGWKRILEAFQRGCGADPDGGRTRHYFGWARGTSTQDCAPGNDPTRINDDSIWDGMEISWHPAKEITSGTTITSGQTIDDDAKPLVKAKFDKYINGDASVDGLNYEAMVTYCIGKKIPFIISENDPSKTAGTNLSSPTSSLCWVPDWAGQWSFEKYQVWDAALRAAGTRFIQATFSTANTQNSWPYNATEDAVLRATIDNGTSGIPQWYLKELASGAQSSISFPVSDAVYTKIKNEWIRRHTIWTAYFKSRWGL